MKKLLLIVPLLLLLVACGKDNTEDIKEQVTEFSFNGNTYNYVDTDSTGYDEFSHGPHWIEINCEDTCIISFEMDEDIYIVTGTSAEYNITKNGTTILFDGEDLNPTGIENPDWNEDIIDILKAYDK